MAKEKRLITSRLKEIKKRRALRGKESPDSYRDVLLINRVGKRTVVLTSAKLSTSLIPSFFTSLILSSLSETLVYQLASVCE